MAVEAIGVVSGLLGIFSFVQDLFPAQPAAATADFQFRIGLDGTPGPNGEGTLSDAGGNIPDIRCWNENQQFLGITTNDDNTCDAGSEVCMSSVETDNAPTYTLFTANNDAICIGWMATTFPGGDKYGTPLTLYQIGNWASACDSYGTGATWYPSNVIVQQDNGEGTPVDCAWLDADGDQPVTGIQLHWIEFGSNNDVQNLDHYCANPPALLFHFDSDPSSVTFLTRKRDMFSSNPSGLRTSPSIEMQRRSNEERRARLSKRFESDPRIVKSHNPAHKASVVCDAVNSVGPSFVSYAERGFCYMPTKMFLNFCDDVESGNCWDDEADEAITKGDLVAKDVLPAMRFTKTIVWEIPENQTTT